jgi:hypothetical protein
MRTRLSSEYDNPQASPPASLVRSGAPAGDDANPWYAVSNDARSEKSVPAADRAVPALAVPPPTPAASPAAPSVDPESWSIRRLVNLVNTMPPLKLGPANEFAIG